MQNSTKEKPASVPYFVFEGVVEHCKWMVKCVCVLAMIAVIVCGSIAAYLIYEHSQYDYESYEIEYTQDGQGLNIIGDGNGVNTLGPEVGDPEESPEAPGQ